jgi:anti-anti-sigma factor
VAENPRLESPAQTEGALKVTGALDLAAAEELRNAFAGAIARLESIVVDASEVDACDTAGLQLLISARNTAIRLGKSWRITALSPVVIAAATSIGLPVEQLFSGPSGEGANALGL